MVIRSKDRSYEVIQRLEDTGLARHYRCRQDTSEESHLVQIPAGSELIPRLMELVENLSFTDLTEYFTGQEWLYLVFLWPRGLSLKQCLGDESWDLKRRYEAGQHILERLILLQVPVWMYPDLLDAERIFLEADSVDFYYTMERVSGLGMEADIGGLFAAGLLEPLFSQEMDGGRYPEVETFINRLSGEETTDLMTVYQGYLELLPVCMEDRPEEKKKREPLLDRIKRHSEKLLTGLKLLMGAAVLVAAVAMLPSLWQEKVEPVLSAALMWKSVYVDGETLEAETEPEETGPEEDPDNGFVLRYWDNGSVLYRGNVADGLYEGKGTLYYANGTLQYQGEFAFGKKEGEGSLYTDQGILLYEGGFRKDLYEGAGKLYSAENGNLVYDGEFAGGKYSGTGTLFDFWSEFPVYDGTFRLGFYDGKGVEYGLNGAPLYEGEFLLGVYHGHGTYYDAGTGLVMAEGEFRNGNLVPPDPAEDEPDLQGLLASDSNATEVMEGGIYERTDDTVVVPEAG